MSRNIGEAGLELIKSFETLQFRAYRDSGGVLTIGWGHTKDVREGDVITEAQAEELIKADLAEAEECVNRHAPKLYQHEFDACVSLVFNIGCAAFGKSTLLRMIRIGDFKSAAKQFDRWNKDNGVVLAGLTRRRAAERKLFEPPDFANVESGVTTTAQKVDP